MVVSGVTPGWKVVKSDVPQGSVLGPDPFNTFMRDLDERIKSILSLCMTPSWTGVLEDRKAPLRDLDRLDQ